MAYIPKQITKRLEELESKLQLAIMFGDCKRCEYLQEQVGILEDKIEIRRNN